MHLAKHLHQLRVGGHPRCNGITEVHQVLKRERGGKEGVKDRMETEGGEGNREERKKGGGKERSEPEGGEERREVSQKGGREREKRGGRGEGRREERGRGRRELRRRKVQHCWPYQFALPKQQIAIRYIQ